jgi:shikimate 5-dehydrogenase
MAEAKGYKIADGLDMMVYQGTEAFRLWTGHDVPAVAVQAAREQVMSKLNGKATELPLSRPVIQKGASYES